MKQQRILMAYRNPFLSHDEGNMFLLDNRRDTENSQRIPFSPETIPQFNPASLNAFSQIKQTKLHSSKLNYLIEPEDEMGPKSRIITMFSDADGSIHAHDEAANVLQRYSSNEIAFIGIWGSKYSDKGFFYDRIIDLCDVKESKYSRAAENADGNALIYFYERPFVKNNIRIFLLDCRGYQNPQNLSKEEKIQLDILMGLCQIIILTESTTSPEINVRPRDIIQIGYDHFNDSFKRLYLDKSLKQYEVSEISWPISLMILFSSPKSIKIHQNSNAYQEELQKMFQDYNFSVLHNKNRVSENEIKSYTTINNEIDELYSKNSSTIFKDMYDKIHRKVYLGMKFTGFTCPHILTQLSNSANKGGSLSFPRSFEKAKVSTYASLYNRQAIAYLIKLKPYLHEQKSYCTDHLIQAFTDSREQTFKEYDECHTDISVGSKNDDLYSNYEQKLNNYIDEKQKNIINVNFKKSMKELTASRPIINDVKHEDLYGEYQQLILKQSKDRLSCDPNADTFTAANVIKSLYRIKLAPSSDMQVQAIQEKRMSMFRKQQEKQLVMKTRIQTLEDHKEAKQKQKIAIKHKSKFYSEQIKKTLLSIENLKKEVDNSLHEVDQKERDRRIVEMKEELAILQQKYQQKKKTLKNEEKESDKKTQKQNKLQKKLQSTISNLKEMQGSIINVETTKVKRYAQIRRVDVDTKIRRAYRD